MSEDGRRQSGRRAGDGWRSDEGWPSGEARTLSTGASGWDRRGPCDPLPCPVIGGTLVGHLASARSRSRQGREGQDSWQGESGRGVPGTRSERGPDPEGRTDRSVREEGTDGDPHEPRAVDSREPLNLLRRGHQMGSGRASTFPRRNLHGRRMKVAPNRPRKHHSPRFLGGLWFYHKITRDSRLTRVSFPRLPPKSFHHPGAEGHGTLLRHSSGGHTSKGKVLVPAGGRSGESVPCLRPGLWGWAIPGVSDIT